MAEAIQWYQDDIEGDDGGKDGVDVYFESMTHQHQYTYNPPFSNPSW